LRNAFYEARKSQMEFVNGNKEEGPLSPLYCKPAVGVVVAGTQVDMGFRVTFHEYPIKSRAKEARTKMRCAIRVHEANSSRSRFSGPPC
jgi:hypothetical protein